MWLKKLRRLIRLFFFQLTGKKGDKVAKLTKPVIAVNIDGTVRVLNQDPNATHFNWYTRELLSYNITSPSYDTVVAGTNESTTALPNSSYTNRVYITESYRDIRKFTSFKLYEAESSAVDVTELYVTKISDFEYSISIPNVEHDYIITWGVGAITYTITSSLTNCVADKSDESYVGGTAVNIVITAATGYTFDSSLGGTIGLSVGEVDKTSEYMTRSSDNKKVTIAIPAIAAVGNIIYAAGAVEEVIIDVVKGDLIQMDVGFGTQKFRVLKIDDKIAFVIAMENYTGNISFGGWIDAGRGVKYDGSNVDNVLNNTYYSNLNSTAKSAIVNSKINPYGYHKWSSSSASKADYVWKEYPGGTSDRSGFDVDATYSELDRYVFAISLTDIFHYFLGDNATSGTINYINVWDTFWQVNSASRQTPNFWTRDHDSYSDPANAAYLYGYGGYVANVRYDNESAGARPAFKIDLSKINYTKVS